MDVRRGDASWVVYEPEREADHLEPSSAEANNAWIHPCAYLYPVWLHTDKFIFSRILHFHNIITV